jgi:hypothetical protein
MFLVVHNACQESRRFDGTESVSEEQEHGAPSNAPNPPLPTIEASLGVINRN